MQESDSVKSSDGYADLHLHTNRSDGHYSPIELVDKCVASDLQAIAIVDHDEIGGIAEAVEYGHEKDIEVISGVELSVAVHDRDVHILGYCFDLQDDGLNSYLSFLKQERLKRARKILEQLARMGMPVHLDAVLSKAGLGSVGRPHIAQVLVEEGYVNSFQEAFNKYLADGKPGNVQKHKLDIAQAFALIVRAGGVCSLAHPGLHLSEKIVLHIIKSGVDAIEVVHPKHNGSRMDYFRGLARQYGLLETGGSDFHGGNRGEDFLGKYRVPYATVAKLKELAAEN